MITLDQLRKQTQTNIITDTETIRKLVDDMLTIPFIDLYNRNLLTSDKRIYADVVAKKFDDVFGSGSQNTDTYDFGWLISSFRKTYDRIFMNKINCFENYEEYQDIMDCLLYLASISVGSQFK